MLDVLSGFVAELRAAGLPVSVTEHLDAAAAVGHIPLEDRALLKTALAATLVKSGTHLPAFDTAFETWFAIRGETETDFPIDSGFGGVVGVEDAGEAGHGPDGASRGTGRGGLLSGGGAGETMSAEELAALLYQALLTGDDALSRQVARRAVARYAGMEPGRPVGGTYYLYRTLRNLDLDGVLGRLMAQAHEDTTVGERSDGELTPFEERLASDGFRIRIGRLRRHIEQEIRRLLVEDRGAETLARSVRAPLPEDIDVMHASREELAMLRRTLQPLSRKLAVRLARKRRHGKRGPLDFRATIRRSLASGGVPIDPRFRRPRPAKPEIMVVADISGSVASFARFTLHLVHAISSQFSKVRSFVFIDGIDEVTRLFEGAEDPAHAVHRVTVEADVTWVDGHSDYGNALSVFWDRWGEEISPRTSILILGDARNNYHASQAWVLAELRNRARHVYWLNPEPLAYWGSGDSIIDEYAGYCDRVVECRTLRQLEQFVGELS